MKKIFNVFWLCFLFSCVEEKGQLAPLTNATCEEVLMARDDCGIHDYCNEKYNALIIAKCSERK